MTETDWNVCTNSMPMLAFLRGRASDRKLRLFAVACCRRIWHLLTDERSRKAVGVAEMLADGQLADPTSIRDAVAGAVGVTAGDSPLRFAVDAAAYAVAPGEMYDAAVQVAWKVQGAKCWSVRLDPMEQAAEDRAFAQAEQNHSFGDIRLQPSRQLAQQQEQRTQASILHDLFGNPFRLVDLDPAWLTPTLKQLAAAIYEERAFDRLPILADVLEETGCTNADILNHCRQPGEHVRGCWVVDLLLGKG